MSKVFLVNPCAGNGTAGDLDSLIRSRFPGSIVEITKSVEHLKELTKIYSGSGNWIYSVGGDGTASEIINAIEDRKNTVLVVIPAGSGNDFIKSYTSERDPKQILLNDNYDLMTIDIGSVKYEKKERLILNVGTIGGVDAEIGDYANRLSMESTHSEKYSMLQVLNTLMKFEAPRVAISFNDQTIVKRITILAVCNGQYYGGKYNVAPQASLTDGLFDICRVDNISRYKIPFLMPVMEKGRHIDHNKYPFVSFYRTDYIKIEAEVPIIGNFDGESITSDIFELFCIKEGATIAVPKSLVKRK